VRKKDDMLQALIKELNQTPGIRGSIILYSSGVIKASGMPENIDPDRIGARVGIIAGTGQNVSRHIKIGEPEYMRVDSSEGMIITVRINPNVFLSVLVKQGANKGIVDLAIDKVKNRIARLV
ncbi:MAG: roadblock/LC7 domain-containing protein, partial [Candidatus Aenigmarchaeota archaeon]|nr:roadblock/LC7 domain-containing protein [Candidatus Aenigmarchaeota archaeon]